MSGVLRVLAALALLAGPALALAALVVWWCERQPPPLAPARWLGWQEGLPGEPAFALYTLTADIPGHPKGSTVSAETLIAAGYRVPAPWSREEFSQGKP